MAGLIGAGQGLRNLANQGMAKVASADVQAEILREQEEMANEAGEKQLLGTAGGIGGMIGATKAMALTKAAGATAGGVTAAGTTAAVGTGAAAAGTGAAAAGAAAAGGTTAAAGSMAALGAIAAPIAIALGVGFLINKLF
tara:strand:- start:358 stop:777 length:420 start_codon:yes stop_codon:yes gene_type:complete